MNLFSNIKKQLGFSLIELLIVISMIAILSAMLAPYYSRLQGKNNIQVARQALERSLFRAQELSRAMASDGAWGVHCENGFIRTFFGTTYAGRTVSLDEDVRLASNISFSGSTEIFFAKFTGLPTATGSIVITGAESQTATVTINSFGMTDY
jgi:prepilin-type N-terminal cleavage/methylation domain-containing protein